MLKQGIITRIDGKTCMVHSDGEIVRAYIRKNLKGSEKNSSKPVCVGDQVSLEKNDQWVITEVGPRKSRLSRKAVNQAKEQMMVSNVDQLLIVTSLFSPPFHPGIIDRFLVAALKGNIIPIICVNKADLRKKTKNMDKILMVLETYQQLGYTVLLTSVRDNMGLEELTQVLKDKSTVLAGHSGVGKSSLLLAVDANLQLVTKEISHKSNRGQHATSSVSLLPLHCGGYVVDTPGIREFTFWELEEAEVSQYFPEMRELSRECKYRRCTHTHEPACAVKEALLSGSIAAFRYGSYCHIIESIKNPTISSRPDPTLAEWGNVDDSEEE